MQPESRAITRQQNSHKPFFGHILGSNLETSEHPIHILVLYKYTLSACEISCILVDILWYSTRYVA